jgi:hypothetical protein
MYNEKIILSKHSIAIIEMILRGEYKKKKLLKTFLKSCYFFKCSLEYEQGDEGDFLYLNDYSVLSKKQKKMKVDNIVDNSITGYLSSIEIASSSQSDPNTCKVCGQLKYSISYRINEFMDKYFDEEFEANEPGHTQLVDDLKRRYKMNSVYKNLHFVVCLVVPGEVQKVFTLQRCYLL